MRFWGAGRPAQAGFAAVALLVGCGGRSQLPIGASGVLPQSVPAKSSFRVLYRFNGPDGANPEAHLIDVKGTLYGTTIYGGRYGYGTVFSLTLSGSQKVLYSFRGGTDGSAPVSSLLDVNDELYGTTSMGGGSACLRYGCGTVFSVSLTGFETVIHRFRGGSDGANPQAALIDVDGTLYGTTNGGGTSDDGTVYTIDTSGKERILYSFAGGDDAAHPVAPLVSAKGVLYGTTVFGGAAGIGTVYRVSTAGNESVLHSFRGRDGANPLVALIDVKGTLYGTTSAGGDKSSRGTAYSIGRGEFDVLHNFRGRSGESPYSGLISVKHVLYGTTDQGGTRRLYGTVYSLTTDGAERVLHRFSGGPGGSHPWAGVIDVKGTLYGTTFDGGKGCAGGGCGTIFAISL